MYRLASLLVLLAVGGMLDSRCVQAQNYPWRPIRIIIPYPPGGGFDGTMRLVHVPYKGSGPAITDALGGQIEVVITPLSNLIQHIRAGKLRGIAVMSRNRASIMPELPTFAEAGVPSVQADSWYGLFAPAGTPEAVQKRLHEAAVQALAQADVIERLRKAGYEPGSSTPEALAEALRTDLQKWVRVVADAKIPKQ